MAYSAIEKMRKKNEQIYGKGVGPTQPALSDGAAAGFDLKSAALRFLHERCEGLLFDSHIEEDEERTGLYRGVSLAPGRIPYNMQMDIDRLCLERELEKFMDSAATQEAVRTKAALHTRRSLGLPISMRLTPFCSTTTFIRIRSRQVTANPNPGFQWICIPWPGYYFCATNCNAGTAPHMEEIPEKSCIPWLWSSISVKTGSAPGTCSTKRSRAK